MVNVHYSPVSIGVFLVHKHEKWCCCDCHLGCDKPLCHCMRWFCRQFKHSKWFISEIKIENLWHNLSILLVYFASLYRFRMNDPQKPKQALKWEVPDFKSERGRPTANRKSLVGRYLQKMVLSWEKAEAVSAVTENLGWWQNATSLVSQVESRSRLRNRFSNSICLCYVNVIYVLCIY